MEKWWRYRKTHEGFKNCCDSKTDFSYTPDKLTWDTKNNLFKT